MTLSVLSRLIHELKTSLVSRVVVPIQHWSRKRSYRKDDRPRDAPYIWVP